MAKSNLSWDLADGKLIVTILATDKKLTFDLVKIYPDYTKMSDVQQKLIAYGLKQKLADKCAKPSGEKLTPAEMEVELKALWDRLVSGVWHVAGTGRESKLVVAWNAASDAEKIVLEKLGLKPVAKK